MIYRNQDRILNAAMQCMPNFLPESNEPVRIYANWMNAYWRAAGLLLQNYQSLYEVAWSGLQPALKFKIKQLTPKNGNFASMEELFNSAADSEI